VVRIKPKAALTKVKVRSRVLIVLAILTEACTPGGNPSELEKRGGPYQGHGGPYQTHGGPYQSEGEKPSVDGPGDSY
jgi:hypothetical protein